MSVQYLPLERGEEALSSRHLLKLDEADQLPAAPAHLVEPVGKLAAFPRGRPGRHARKLLVLPLALGNEPRLGAHPRLGRKGAIRFLGAGGRERASLRFFSVAPSPSPE
jgi:hypothetical protein